MATSGVFTDGYRERQAAVADLGAPLDGLKLAYVKWGCANLPAGSLMPLALSTYTDIQALGGLPCPLPGSLPGGSEPVSTGQNWYYSKALGAADVSAAAGVLTVQCRLEAGEANDDGLGANPSLYELGLFDDEDYLMAYIVFDEVIKTDEKAIQRNVEITF
jgi:hypothetical protein